MQTMSSTVRGQIPVKSIDAVYMLGYIDELRRDTAGSWTAMEAAERQGI